METVFHDVPFVAGPKMWSKATHVAGKVWSQLNLSRNLALIDLSAVPLRKLGISRKDLIECDGTQYPETRAWALALHDQYPNAEGLTWTSRRPILRALSSCLKTVSPALRSALQQR